MTQNDAGPGGTTVVPQGDLRLLESDLARRLLASTVPARFAFVWTDGTPRRWPSPSTPRHSRPRCSWSA
ncbi:MAG TPA: hypothetical protein VG637_08685, partial [Actinomycetes bacterium]|nr:hypothetical protein [Actinomycetes bacterium]